MRSKAKLNGRTNTTCSVCGKRLASAAALRAHKNSEHIVQQMKSVTRSGKPRGRLVSKKATENSIKKNKQMEKLRSDIISSPLVILKNVRKPSLTVSETSENSTASQPAILPAKKTVNVGDKIHTLFECPLCQKSFLTNFNAVRHIQKFHSGAQKPVPVKSVNTVEPPASEVCKFCNEKTNASKPHLCMMKPFKCSGCERVFQNVKQFNQHISKVHQVVESLFFPTFEEFTSWKDYMEMQTGVKYGTKEKHENKQYYGCTATPSDATGGESGILVCPSTIITQEFVKGLQVHFYVQHCGHTCKKFVLVQKFKKYCINSFMETNEVDITNVKADDNDLYIQFKTLMESIVLDSAKIKIDTLRLLIGKALEMTSVLNNYNDDEDDNMNGNNSGITNELLLTRHSNLSDNDISKALEGLRSSARLKRKASVESSKAAETETKTVKETKATNASQLNQELANICADMNKEPIKDSVMQHGSDEEKNINNENQNKDSYLMKKPVKRQKPRSIKSKLEATPQSLGGETGLISGISSTITTDAKDEMKTSPDKQDSDLKTDMPTKTPLIKPKDIKELTQTPSSFNDSYREFVEQCKVGSKPNGKNGAITNKDMPKTKVPKKKLLKTRMGQFTPTTSPRKSPSTKSMSPVYNDLTQIPIVKPKTYNSKHSSKLQSPNLKTKMIDESSPKIIKHMEKSWTPPRKSLTPTQKQSPILKKSSNIMKQSPIIMKQNTNIIKQYTNINKQMAKVNKPLSPKIIKNASPIISKLASPKSISGSPKSNKSISLTNLTNVKIDRYEVKEQENDCNILILKI